MQINNNNINKDYIICEKEQSKIFDNLETDLVKKFGIYEKLVNNKINDIKVNLNNQAKQFEDILKEIKNNINGNLKFKKN